MTANYPQSAPTRTKDEIETLECIDARVRDVASSFGAREMQYPALIARQVLEQAGYPQAFPHLLMTAGHDVVPNAGDGDDVRDWCLSPAVCYHAFAQLAGRVIEGTALLTARGRCFRAERDTAPGTRQTEFEMREIVLLGPISWIDECADAVRLEVQAIALDLGLSGEWQAAEDPFFLPAAAGKAMMQRLMRVKLEYQSPGAGGLALASINRHGAFFGRRFGITTPEGEPVHTACIAIGLDRWSHRSKEARQ